MEKQGVQLLEASRAAKGEKRPIVALLADKVSAWLVVACTVVVIFRYMIFICSILHSPNLKTYTEYAFANVTAHIFIGCSVLRKVVENGMYIPCTMIYLNWWLSFFIPICLYVCHVLVCM